MNGVSPAVAYCQGWIVILVLYGVITCIMIVQCWSFEAGRDETGIRGGVIVDQSSAVESTPLKIDVLGGSNLDTSPAIRSSCDKPCMASGKLNHDAIDYIDSRSNIPHHSKQSRSIIHRSNLSPFIFPILFASLFQLVFTFSPIGGAGNPAMGLARVYALRQLVSLFGEIYLVFWMGWLATISVGWGIVPNSRTTKSTCPNGHMVAFVTVTLFMFLYGSIRELSGRGFYWDDISQWPTTMANEAPLKVSCVTRAESKDNRTALQTMVSRTNERLAAGDDLIMWSESAVDEMVSP
jgi:hypothetical protein